MGVVKKGGLTLLAALLLAGCTTVSFRRDDAWLLYADLRAAYAVLAHEYRSACKESSDACEAAKQLMAQLRAADATFRRGMAESKLSAADIRAAIGLAAQIAPLLP